MDKDILFKSHIEICDLMVDDVHGRKVKPFTESAFEIYQEQYEGNFEKYLDIIGAMLKRHEDELNKGK